MAKTFKPKANSDLFCSCLYQKLFPSELTLFTTLSHLQRLQYITLMAQQGNAYRALHIVRLSGWLHKPAHHTKERKERRIISGQTGVISYEWRKEECLGMRVRRDGTARYDAEDVLT